MSEFDFTKLLPLSPANLFSGAFNAEQLSSAFIYGILLFAVGGLIYVVYQACFSIRLIRFIKRLTKDLQPEELLAKREQLKTKAEKYRSKNGYVGKLWKEFDETLVVQNGQLKKTVDASYFFNSHTLAKAITESRFLAAFPGMLTAAGILGTFVGLSLGLQGLDFKNIPDPKQIQVLISGVSVAFATSVWGIFTSLLFNAFEKGIEATVQNEITELQQNIDFLYPKIVSEQTLVKIKESTEESKNLFSQLGEQIGNKMQEALDGSFQPAIDKLVNAAENLAQRQSETSEDALKSLVGQFTKAVSTEGKNYQQGLENSISQLNEIIKSSGSQVTEQISRSENILQQGKDLTERNEQIHTQFEQTLTALSGASARIDEAAAHMQEFGGEIKAAADLFSSKQLEAAETLASAGQENRAVVERFELLLNQIEQIRTNFLNVIEGLQGSTRHFGETTGNFIENLTAQLESWQSQQATQDSVNETILNQARLLNEQFQSNQETMQDTNEVLRNSFEKFEGASAALEDFGGAIQSATETMSQQQSEALEAAKSAAAQNLKASEQFESLFENLEQMQGQFSDLGNSIKEATQNFLDGFDDLKKDAKEISETHMEYIDKLGNQFDEHLTKYSDKVRSQTIERLDQWNQQTTRFSGLMTEATAAMKETIEEVQEIIEEIKKKGDE